MKATPGSDCRRVQAGAAGNRQRMVALGEGSQREYARCIGAI